MEIKNLILPETSLTYFNSQIIQNPKVLARKLKIDAEIIKVWNNWFYINNNWYYYKNFFHYEKAIENFINELIGEFLSSYLKLNTVKYNIGCTVNSENQIEYGLLSENFRDKKRKYIIPTDLYLDSDCMTLNNLENLKKYFKSEHTYNMFLLQLLKMTAIDIYMNQKDRKKNNILFEKQKDGFSLAPLYDYEKSFITTESSINNLQYSCCIFGVDISNSKELNKYPKLKEFLELIINLDIEEILDYICNKYNIKIPETERKKYENNSNKRKKLIKKCL